MSSLEVTDLSQMMENSWKRCQSYGLKPSDPVYDDIITGNRIRELTRQHEQLIRHTEQIFAKMNRLIKQSGQMALLIDAQGTILHSVGDPDFSNRAERVQLQVGANWEERRKGTNAIGLALTEHKAVRVHAGEHYYTSNRFLTCASSPVFNSSGQLIGVINISGKKESYHDYTLTLACMAADSLQNKLIWEETRDEHLITLKELDYTAQNVPMPLLSLDRDNRIVRANQAALRIVGRDALGKEFKGAAGFAIETIHGDRHKIWRSVAIQRKAPGEPRWYEFQDIIGTCPKLLQTKEIARKAALTDYPVLLLGESGTGKELFAQSIHTASPRSAQPFIAVNCSAIPDSLIESELFGYERGAFTGANREGSIGKFEAAHKGTIFLDEIGDMSLRAQAALLRVLQESTITPVGGTKSRRVDIRIVAATHRSLAEEVKAGRFRADLYYRLKGIQITLPSLRERSDIVPLAAHLLHNLGHPASSLTEQAQLKLRHYSWPGNIRELNSALLQASFLAEGAPIDAWHLQLGEDAARPDASGRSDEVPSLKEAEMEAIKRALRQTGGNLSKAASLLQIGRTTLYRKIQEYDLTPF
ncbi:sigma-54-dependent Fis family transcriptional regulator [Paenibacillus sp. 32352]|uniref:sigma-54-dependent Fis family transcriptional regulator n=1 Tax=Paenibacillus sp. 32352 TaxID=1969111 RepID=UPI00277B4E5B|nr:sigma-54-dependent Fis family transcriptional regulator [Paenibacillus sp. 32352]